MIVPAPPRVHFGNSLVEWVGYLLWYISILALPITSFALFPINSSARPLSLVLAVVGIGMLLMAGKLSWPEKDKRIVLWLLIILFIHSLIITFIMALYGSYPPMKGYTATASALKGLLSLAAGISFYFVSVVALQSEKLRNGSYVFLVLGMGLSVILALIQTMASHGSEWAMAITWWVVNHVTFHYDVNGFLATHRAWGLSLEPSWMASMLTVLLLPLALAYWRKNTNFISCFGIIFSFVGVGLTASRGGLIAIAAITLIWFFHQLYKAWREKVWRATLTKLCFMTFMLIVCFGISSRSKVFHLFEDTARTQKNEQKGNVETKLRGLGFLFRYECAKGAAKTFLESPVIGSGVGLSGWGIRRHMMLDPSPIFEANEEYIAIASEEGGVMPNAKNMPLRVLAETGVIGFLILVSFIVCHRPRTPYNNFNSFYLPIIVLVALAIDWLSLDGFALTAPWLALAWSRQLSLAEHGTEASRE